MNVTAVYIIGTTSISVLLASTLEVDVVNVAICLGNLYQGVLGCDVLCGHNKALGLAINALPRPD